MLGFNHPGPAFLYVQSWGEDLFWAAGRIVPTAWNGQLIAVYALNAVFAARVFATREDATNFAERYAGLRIAVTWKFSGRYTGTPDFGPPLGSGWPSGCTQASATCYDIASLDLSLGSPQLGSLLSGITTAVGSV